MDTGALKSFAVSARVALIREVRARLNVVKGDASAARVESPNVVKALDGAIIAAGGGGAGQQAVVDRAAYTWFNRIIALRFMDANGYTGIGVVSPEAGRPGGQPEVLAEAKRGHFDGKVVDAATAARVTSLLNGTARSADAQGEAYGLLLAEYCRFWNRSMPFMFEREGDYTELLVPADLLADDSVLARAVEVLTPEVCADVEVIGWMYQFYISERKDEVFAGFKKNKKAGPAEIPAATQLFTPDWIVRYLLENTLGRLWLLNRPASNLAAQMDYYIAPVEVETDFLKVGSPEELKVMDPACGSGHMLTYAFDLLYAIYEEEGYGKADIPRLILENNLFGAEIDQRSGSLAAFALTMKARDKQRTFFTQAVKPNICVLEPISFTPEELGGLVTLGGDRVSEEEFWNQFADADTFGSLICPRGSLLAPLKTHLQLNPPSDLVEVELHRRASLVLEQAHFLSERYQVVVANPPYMGASRMGALLSGWLRRHLPAGRAGLDTAFWERAGALAMPGGYMALVTMQSWMFLATYSEFRRMLVRERMMVGLAHLGTGAFPEIAGEVVSTAAAIMKNCRNLDYSATYVRLVDKGLNKAETLRKVARGETTSQVYVRSIRELEAIPRTPIAYWMGERERGIFGSRPPISKVAGSGNGLTSSDNEKFLRFWWEVEPEKIEARFDRDTSLPSTKRWFPINKGGGFRRWAGNRDYVVDWAHEGRDLLEMRPASTIRNMDQYFKPSVSWSDVVTGPVSFRYFPTGWIFDASANSIFPIGDDVEGILAYGNSSFVKEMAPLLNPGTHFKLGDMDALPYLKRTDEGWQGEVHELVRSSEEDWDSAEPAFAFSENPLNSRAALGRTLREALFDYLDYTVALSKRVNELECKNNQEISRQFELGEKYAAEVDLSETALLQNSRYLFGASIGDDDRTRRHSRNLLVDFIHYSVGCMFGRYTSVQNGPEVVLGQTFVPDVDGVIPIIDGAWFEDDIVAQFRSFLRVTFGALHFEENMALIEDTLGTDIRKYFVTDFYEDHVKRYKRRPIYWLFSSPKGAFSALINMHRYTPSTVSTVLNEYLREYRGKLEAERENQQRNVVSATTSRDKARAEKEVDRLRKVLLELQAYEDDVLYPLATQRISIDLDDGVLVNYLRLGEALRNIPEIAKKQAEVDTWEWPSFVKNGG